MFPTAPLKYEDGPACYPSRIIEWQSSLFMLGFALNLIWPGPVEGHPYHRLVEFTGLSETALAIVIGLFSTGWMAALWINGRWRRSPLVRAFCAAVGASLFAQLSLGFFMQWKASGFVQPPLGIWMCAVASIFSLHAVWRSVHDGAVPKRSPSRELYA